MEKPKFFTEFSKEESPEERKETADKIREKRGEHFEKREERTSRQEEIQEEIGEREKEIQEIQKKAEDLAQKLDELNDSRISRWVNYFKIRKLQQEQRRHISRAEGLMGVNELAEEQSRGVVKDFEDAREIEETHEILQGFYRRQEDEWTHAPYEKEDVVKYFTEEHLASLSLEEYALLMKRFPGEMVTHVVRQGVRDHGEMLEHQTGSGEYHDGFMQILKDGRLKTPFGVYLAEEEKEQSVATFLALEKTPSREYALGRLEKELDAKTFVDRRSAHFAVEEVADAFYGAERGNEIYIAYPSVYIASQYYFGGKGVAERYGGKNNDLWVWDREERGMDINAGIVFISADAEVSPRTGSKYEIDERGQGVPKEGGKNLKKAQETISSREFWEEYFKRFPEKRPSKIVYYTGGDPTAALQKFKQEHGIYKETENDQTMGFSEHTNPPDKLGMHQFVPEDEVREKRSRFENLARLVIDKHFASKKK